MRTLAIETATEACSVALFEGTELLARDHRTIGRGHAEQLVPMIGALPGKGKAERILVSLGPGSFTGVRIGIATARALGCAWRAEVLGYPTMALVATMAQNEHAEPVTVCMTGGHGEWFVQNFDLTGEPDSEMASLSPESAVPFAKHTLVAGSKAQELATISTSKYLKVLHMLPDASLVSLLPENSIKTALAPIYGRPPDAKPQHSGLSNILKFKANSA